MARSPDARIEWFLDHNPAEAGLCLNHTWRATDIPAAGQPDANAAGDYIAANGHLHRDDRKPPRGAWVLWSSSTFGHAALALGDGRIASTDVKGAATVGIVDLSYPETHWGHHYRGWSSWYGIEFDVGKDGDDMPLSGEDLDKIANRVWQHDIKNTADAGADDTTPAQIMLRNTRNTVRDQPDPPTPADTADAVWRYNVSPQADEPLPARKALKQANDSPPPSTSTYLTSAAGAWLVVLVVAVFFVGVAVGVNVAP